MIEELALFSCVEALLQEMRLRMTARAKVGRMGLFEKAEQQKTAVEALEVQDEGLKRLWVSVTQGGATSLGMETVDPEPTV